MSITVSCIIPVHNGERFLGEAIESVLAQTHPIHEILIVDDGSTDGTKALVEQYPINSSTQLHYLWQANGGVASARNRGIQSAQGEFVTFLDADDLWHPEKTERQLGRFAARPELDLSVTYVQNFWMDEVRDEAEHLRNHARARPVAGYITQSLMVRRSIFEQIGLLNTSLRYADSTEWFLRAQEAKLIDELLSDVLVHRRLHNQNMTRRFARASRAEFLLLIHKTHTRQHVNAMNEA